MNGRGFEEIKPVVAILTMDSTNGFRGNRDNFVDIVRTGKDMGFLVYVVTIRDLKFTSPTVKGYTLNSSNDGWETHQFPLPQVIYNRIPLREDEEKPWVHRKILTCLQHPDIQFYNPYFFNKWHLFEWLKVSKSTDYLIPQTKRMDGVISLARLLDKHPYLYLKPESGKAGKGIMMLKYKKNKIIPYRLKIQNDRSSITYKSTSLRRLWVRINKETGHSPYIIQQGIALATVDHRPFDLRILVQKTAKGHWGVTGVGARMAGLKSITTHVPRGGTIESPSKLLSTLFGADMSSSMMSRIRTTALIIARQIEKGSGFTLGEMSMDLGIDALGKLWFFEANARPMKFDEPHIRRKSLERIFEYSQYLARKNNQYN
ncbi:YheC/D like ATP-grasp [Paenibacillus macquariensis]|uniref:YheC/D like ATP-grasp n=2 Tax=Paenibacillus macquariensis TaxID=948756 RepID=A0ABY1JXQ5_9BACL|nr:YheC/D like ATP-grasp [Paenibacillus macquariensis]